MGVKESLADFRRIPGVGEKLARVLWDLGYRRVEELIGENPENMYETLVGLRGVHVDRCVLYVFRCAVYFAETPEPEPEKLKWWYWKEGSAQLF